METAPEWFKERLEAAGYTITCESITENVTICRATHQDGRGDEVVASSVVHGISQLIQRLAL